MFSMFKKRTAAESKSTSYILGMSTAMSGIGNSYTKLATEGYSQNPIAFACISKLASCLASVDLYAYTDNAKGEAVRKPGSLLAKLLERPNAMQSGRSFREEFATQYLIGGNCFLTGTKVGAEQGYRELFILPPNNIEIDKGDMLPKAYIYKPTPEKTVTYPVDIKGQSAVLHIKTPNPLDRWTGLPPMAAAAAGIDIFNSGMRWNKKLLDNDCRPAGALSVEDNNGAPRTLSEEQRLQLKEAITANFSGANNAGKPLLLQGGLKWQQLSIAPKDMDFKENMLMAARFTASVFGVPPQLVNIPGESTYSNYAQAELSLWSDTVLPLLGSMLEDINRWLSPNYGGEYLWYDEEAIPALESLRKEKGERINNSNYLSTDEKRGAMGYGITEGGDEVLIDSGKIPLSLLDASITEPAPQPEPAPAPAPEPTEE